MAKNSIRDYSATNSSNTDIQSIDISEGCSPAGINNAIREVMADLKDVSTGAVALESPAFDSVTGNLNVNGTVTADGVESTCAAGDANQALLAYHPTSTSARTIAKFQSNVGGTQQDKVVIKCDGSVGIGTSSPSRTLTVNSGATNTAFRLESTDAEVAMQFYDGTQTSTIQGGTSGLTFSPNATVGELLRLDSSGNTTFINTFSATVANGPFVYLGASGTVNIGTTLTTAKAVMGFRNPNGEVGQIITNGSATSFVTSSDYRLKENVVADWDATTRLKQLNPVRFNFIADADTTVDGFLAHEVQTVVPEAITGTKDAMRDEEYEVSAATGDIYTPAVEATYDDDGVELTAAVDEVIHSTDAEQPDTLEEGQQWRETTAAVMSTRSVPNYQGIDQSKLTPLLTKALIEAVEKIEQLEARITALEAN